MTQETLLTNEVIVLCTDKNGSPVFHACTTSVLMETVATGMHYVHAKNEARSLGYEGPMLTFDSMEQALTELEGLIDWVDEAEAHTAEALAA